MKISINIVILFSFLILVIYSCDDTGVNIDDIIIPESNVSYSTYIQPIFTYKCANGACHNPESFAGGLDLTTQAGATADPLIVLPYNPESSRLIWSVEGLNGNKPMPPPYSSVIPLTENQIQALKTWIEEGAKAN